MMRPRIFLLSQKIISFKQIWHMINGNTFLIFICEYEINKRWSDHQKFTLQIMEIISQVSKHETTVKQKNQKVRKLELCQASRIKDLQPPILSGANKYIRCLLCLENTIALDVAGRKIDGVNYITKRAIFPSKWWNKKHCWWEKCGFHFKHEASR